MAGNRIKGITVEIGGDTTKLQTALKGVNGCEPASAVWTGRDQGDAVQEYPGRSVRDPVCAV